MSKQVASHVNRVYSNRKYICLTGSEFIPIRPTILPKWIDVPSRVIFPCLAELGRHIVSDWANPHKDSVMYFLSQYPFIPYSTRAVIQNWYITVLTRSCGREDLWKERDLRSLFSQTLCHSSRCTNPKTELHCNIGVWDIYKTVMPSKISKHSLSIQ